MTDQVVAHKEIATGLNRFLWFMLDWVRPLLTPLLKRQQNLGEITDEDVKLFDGIFRRFSELHDTIENLDLCLDFIKARMPRKKGLKLDRYLQYHITFYLQEIYILNERIDGYTKTVMRLKKRKKLAFDETKYTKELLRVRLSLEKIVKIRGDHVHARAFKDGSLEHLSMYAILANVEEKFVTEARFEYSEAKKIWIKRLEKNKTVMQEVLDRYFDFMFDELTDKYGKMHATLTPAKPLN